MRRLVPLILVAVFVFALIAWASMEARGPRLKPAADNEELLVDLSKAPKMGRFVAPEVIVPIGHRPDSVLLIYGMDTVTYYRDGR